jgi:anti-anti-sigma factor
MLDLKFIVEDRDGITVMKCLGRLDSETYVETKDKILALLNAGKIRLVLDLSLTDYVGSAGWGVIIGHLKEFRFKGGNIVISGANGHVKEVYEIMELAEVLDSYPDLEKALNSFGKSK